MTTTIVATTDLREDASLETAYRVLWLAVIFDFLAGIVDLILRARIP